MKRTIVPPYEIHGICKKEKNIVLLLCVCIRKSAVASWEIVGASADDEGLYECVAQSTIGQGRALTQLTVLGKSL